VSTLAKSSGAPIKGVDATFADAFAALGDVDDGRRAAWDAFARTGLPHRRMEDWRWSDVRGAARELGALAGQSDVSPARIFADLPAHRVTFVNGWIAEPLDDADGLDARGVGAAFESDDRGGPAAALARALSNAPLELVVAPSAALDRPILIRHVADGDGGHSHERVRLVLGEGARATLIEVYEGAGAGLANGLLEIDLADGAMLDRIVVQADDAAIVRVATTCIRLSDGAHLAQTTLAFGAKLARLETHVEHAGEGASVTLDGAYLLDGKRHVDQTTVITHAAPRCETRQTVKGAVRDTATGVFQGRIVVERAAQKTDARMAHHALLLSDGATVNAKPELEIYADDVECAHGNTAGALDPEQLFYMRARGLDEAQAMALLTQAFVAEAFDRVADDEVRALLLGQVSAWLGAQP